MSRAAVVLVLPALVACGPSSETCGSGTWRPGSFEIHHIDLGQADSTLVVSPTGQTLLIDAGETSWDSHRGADRVASYVEQTLGCRQVDHVLLSHFHLDHVGQPGQGGLTALVEAHGFAVGETLHRDLTRYVGERSATFDRWRQFLASAAAARLHPGPARTGDRIDLGPAVTIRIIAVDGNGSLAPGDFSGAAAPPSENDYSVALLLRFGQLDYFHGGDLSGAYAVVPGGATYHDVETHVARGLPDVDVYRVDHHGSEHASNATLLAELDPEVAIASVGEGNRYGHPHPGTVARLLATSALYLTEAGATGSDLGAAKVSGDVVVRSADGRSYTVNGDPYVATDPVRMDADGDGYFREADPDDGDPEAVPLGRGGCDPAVEDCARPVAP